MRRTTSLLALGAAALALLLTPPGEAVTTLRSPVGHGRSVSGNGPAVCNCTDSPATLQVCHASSVTLQIGSSTITVSTGESSTTCATQVVAPGMCTYFRYNFECRPTLFSWDCHLRSTSLWDRPADPQLDC